MTADEFREWLLDFARRFPATGEWASKLPEETLDIWFDEVFSLIEVADAFGASRAIMAQGGIEAYKRESLPAIVSKLANNIAYERRERVRIKKERAAMPARRGKGFDVTSGFDSGMKKAFRRVLEAKEANPYLTKEEIRQIINDNLPDESVAAN